MPILKYSLVNLFIPLVVITNRIKNIRFNPDLYNGSYKFDKREVTINYKKEWNLLKFDAIGYTRKLKNGITITKIDQKYWTIQNKNNYYKTNEKSDEDDFNLTFDYPMHRFSLHKLLITLPKLNTSLCIEDSNPPLITI